MRATWLTDIHLNFLRPLALKAFYDRLKAERPDALLITGDIAEGDSVAKFLNEMVAEVGVPIYFVLGNHDFYRSNIRVVRGDIPRANKRATYMPTVSSVKLTESVAMIGVDGWGDARCGDLASTVQLSDWNLIEELKKHKDRDARNEALQRLGTAEGRLLAEKLEGVGNAPSLVVLTHVPPYPQACVYDDEQSSDAWLPWFTCIATGEALDKHAEAHPQQQIMVLCGHSHGIGTYARRDNLVVRTGGWPAGVEGYGNPVVQYTFDF